MTAETKSEEMLSRQIRRLKPGLIWIKTDEPGEVVIPEKDYEDLIDAGYRFVVTDPSVAITELDDQDLMMLGLIRVGALQERH